MEDMKTNGEKLNTGGKYYSVRISENFGRYLVASQDIPERTLILQENPIVYAPADDNTEDEQIPGLSSSSIIFCLNCCVLLKNDILQNCQLCGWPLCKACDKKTDTIHSKNECKIFQRNGESFCKFPPPQGWPLFYKSILILRILLLIQEKDSSAWPNFFSRLEHHNDARSKKEHCVKADGMISSNLKYFFNDQLFEQSDLIQILIGVVNVNSFGSTKGKNENLRKTKSMFQEGSLFAHSCAPNCTWNIKLRPDVNYQPQIEVFTSIPIKTGELLTIPYNTRHLFYGTLKRQILIESVAHFQCKCDRCQDPTEIGTWMSSIRCFKCEKGFLLPKNACLEESDWECEKCGRTEGVTKVVDFITDVEEYFDKIQAANLKWRKEVEMLQKLFDKHFAQENLLHKNHYVLQEISARILELMVESLQEATLAQIELFLWHCDYLKGIADVILPGRNGYQDQLLDYKTEGLFQKQKNENTEQTRIPIRNENMIPNMQIN